MLLLLTLLLVLTVGRWIDDTVLTLATGLTSFGPTRGAVDVAAVGTGFDVTRPELILSVLFFAPLFVVVEVLGPDKLMVLVIIPVLDLIVTVAASLATGAATTVRPSSADVSNFELSENFIFVPSTFLVSLQLQKPTCRRELMSSNAQVAICQRILKRVLKDYYI